MPLFCDLTTTVTAHQRKSRQSRNYRVPLTSLEVRRNRMSCFSANTWVRMGVIIMNTHRTERERLCTVQDRNRDAGGAGPMGQRQDPPRLLSVFLQERDRLRRIAAGMGMNSADAEDVLQDVFLQVLNCADRFEQENIMMRWLVRTTVNHCLSEHRRRFRRKASRILRRRPDLGQVLGGDRDAADQVSLGEELEAVRRTLIEFDPSLLLIVVLRYFCDLDSKAIAKAGQTQSRKTWWGGSVKRSLRSLAMADFPCDEPSPRPSALTLPSDSRLPCLRIRDFAIALLIVPLVAANIHLLCGKIGKMQRPAIRNTSNLRLQTCACFGYIHGDRTPGGCERE
jgi:RNA polymerase sigma factor (sigma-70 family)